MLTQRQRFLNWLRCQRADHGVVDFATTVDLRDGRGAQRFTTAELETNDALPETLFADLNRLNAAVAAGRVRPLSAAELDGGLPV